jgi:hypothetical protein
LPVELLKEEAGKLLLVDAKIVDQALERTIGNGDLVQENIAGPKLLFLPSLKRAEEIIAGGLGIWPICRPPSRRLISRRRSIGASNRPAKSLRPPKGRRSNWLDPVVPSLLRADPVCLR